MLNTGACLCLNAHFYYTSTQDETRPHIIWDFRSDNEVGWVESHDAGGKHPAHVFCRQHIESFSIVEHMILLLKSKVHIKSRVFEL